MTLALVFEQLLNGVQAGFLLFLVAAGLSLVFGIMNFINLAHGSLYLVGAYTAVGFVSWTGSFLLGCTLAALSTLAAGLAIEVVVARRLYGRSHLDHVLGTFGLVLFIDQIASMATGGKPLFLPLPDFLAGSVTLSEDLDYPVYRLVITAASGLLAVGLWLLIARTRIGMRLRAAATNPAMLRGLGVNARLVYTLVFGLGAALAGLAGIAAAPLVSVQPGMDEQVLILAFVIVVLGGVGSVRGSFFAALLIGIADTMGRAFLPYLLSIVLDARSVGGVASAASASLVYLLMVVTLVVRPAGLFAR